MGGVGSGNHNGPRGRRRGSHVSTSQLEAMRVGMIAARLIKSKRPRVCDECGSKAAIGESLELFQRRWLCGSCLAGDMLPLRIEDFTLSGVSNLGCACDSHGMMSDHLRGPDGDAAKRRSA